MSDDLIERLIGAEAAFGALGKPTAEAVIRDARVRIAALEAELEAASATFDDEEAAHLDTLRLLSIAQAQLEALKKPVGDEDALRSVVSIALDQLPGKLHSEKITLILDAIAPPIVAQERERAAKEKQELLSCLDELHAIVKGESPKLLDEDSGGSSELDLRITAAIRAGAAP